MGIEDVRCICCGQSKSTLEMETPNTCKVCYEDLDLRSEYTPVGRVYEDEGIRFRN